MRRGDAKAKPGTRGGTAWTDGLHPIDGGSTGVLPIFFPTSESLNDGPGLSTGNGTPAVSEKTWFEPVVANDTIQILDGSTMECKDGVCPVPWTVKEEAPTVLPDTVNHPPHYTDGGIECIEAIEAALTNEEFRGYCKANCIKYIWRERHKGSTESLKKAQWYLSRLIQLDETQKG